MPIGGLETGAFCEGSDLASPPHSGHAFSESPNLARGTEILIPGTISSRMFIQWFGDVAITFDGGGAHTHDATVAEIRYLADQLTVTPDGIYAFDPTWGTFTFPIGLASATITQINRLPVGFIQAHIRAGSGFKDNFSSIISVDRVGVIATYIPSVGWVGPMVINNTPLFAGDLTDGFTADIIFPVPPAASGLPASLTISASPMDGTARNLQGSFAPSNSLALDWFNLVPPS